MKPLLNILSLGFKSLSLLNLIQKSLRKKTYREAFVLSVDNLSFGGTGKTTLVRAIGEFLQTLGIPFAVVSRGYRSKFEKEGVLVSANHDAEAVGDEARLLKRAFPDRDIFIGRDRHRSIRAALARKNRCVLLDDGFQSTDIHKDLSILLINPAHPYFYLRNFRFLAKRADIILSLNEEIPVGAPEARTDHPSEGQPLMAEYGFRIQGFARPDGTEVEMDAHASILGFSALGDNHRFRKDLSRFRLVGFRGFPDHFPFAEGDLQALEEERKSRGAAWLVCTQKDIVKLERLDLTGLPLIYLKNGIQFNIDLYELILNDAREKDFI